MLARYRLERFRLRLLRERLRPLLEPLLLLLLLRLRLLPPERLVLLLERLAELFRLPDDFRRRVEAAFRAALERDDFERDDFERDDFERDAAARPPLRPPFRDALRLVFLPRPEPLFFPPPVSLFTVAQARRSASRRETPRFT